MEIYAAKISESNSESDLEHICAQLPIERQLKIRGFIHVDDALRSAVAGLMLQQLAVKKLQTTAKELTFSQNRYGKPILAEADGFHFNLSHSGEWVTAVVDQAPVGIDIELNRPVDLKIAMDSFTPAEYQDLMVGQESERLHSFFNIWTLKESYLKMLGTGFSRPLESFSIRINHDGAIILNDPKRPGEAYFKQYLIDQQYALSVCAQHNRFPETVSITNWNSLLLG